MVAVGGRSRVASAWVRCVCVRVRVSLCLFVVWCRVMSCVARRCSLIFCFGLCCVVCVVVCAGEGEEEGVCIEHATRVKVQNALRV